MQSTEVILVDVLDQPVGTADKTIVHEQGTLHRAFSVFIFNTKGDMLLQQRAREKYHSGGLWTNACCSHPYPGEITADAAQRRMKEELGMMTPVKKIFDFLYRAELDNGLTEHEFDHVFAGEYEGEIDFNPAEVMAVGYVPMNELQLSIEKNPADYTAWFHIAFPKILAWWRGHYRNKLP